MTKSDKKGRNKLLKGLKKTFGIFANIFLSLMQYRKSKEEQIVEKFDHGSSSKPSINS